VGSSWAVYNLLSACSDCQGYPQAVRMWVVFLLSPSSNLLTQLFTDGLTTRTAVLANFSETRREPFICDVRLPTWRLSETRFYPTDYLPADTKIPYWAATDRKSAGPLHFAMIADRSKAMTWIGNQYSAAQARALAQQGMCYGRTAAIRIDTRQVNPISLVPHPRATLHRKSQLSDQS